MLAAPAQQKAFELPQLRPGDPQMCVHWLKHRQTLLEAETHALRALPPVSSQARRLQVTATRGFAVYHASIVFSKVWTTQCRHALKLALLALAEIVIAAVVVQASMQSCS